MLKLFLPSVCYAIISNRHADFNTLLGHVKVLLNGFFRQNRLTALFPMVSWKLVFHLTRDCSCVMENGNEYWLLDEYPDQLSLFWYEDGELQYSGSDSLGRVSDFTADDLFLAGAK